MLGDFITRCLILVLGYAYPALECYKILEKNRVEIEELRFWCQYWILVAIMTVVERIADVFASWLPMYGEFKLALFIYLWYPKTKGSGYVYQTLLQPYVSKHETDIDRKFLEMRARIWDLAIYYWRNCAELSQDKFFEILQFLAGLSAKTSNKNTEKQKSHKHAPSAPPLPPDGFSQSPKGKSNKWGFFGYQNSTINRAVSEPPKSNPGQVHVRSPSEFDVAEYGYIPNSPSTASDKLLQARLRLRRQKPPNIYII